jgi:uncharacterized protein
MYFKSIPTLLIAIFLSFNTLLAQEIPAKPNRLVNDYTNTLSPSEVNQLEQKLVAFDDSTSNQIAVVILKSVGDYDINEFTLELGRRWGVGGKSKNNGVVLLVALGDRKISIQTGYGLEGALPDVYTKRIIENDIKPYFKNNQYFKGIDAGVNSIIALTKGEYKANPRKKGEAGGDFGSIITLIIIIVIIIALVKKGGGGGNNGGVFDGRGLSNLIFWSMLLGGGNHRNNDDNWGGDDGYYGGSGGGFGGFGGGSFGGGGSSGSW